MNAHLNTLTRMTDALNASTRGELSQTDMIRQWRNGAASLPLPDKFGDVLGNLLDRIEASALFSEESCSFSQKDLLGSLQVWADKARAKLASSQDGAEAPTSQVGASAPTRVPHEKPHVGAEAADLPISSQVAASAPTRVPHEKPHVGAEAADLPISS